MLGGVFIDGDAPSDANGTYQYGKCYKIQWHTTGGQNYPGEYGFLITIGISNATQSQLFIALGWEVYIRQLVNSNWAVWKKLETVSV